MTTREKIPNGLGNAKEWFKGPEVFRRPFKERDIKFRHLSLEPVPRKKKLVKSHNADSAQTRGPLLNYDNIQKYQVGVRILVRIIGAFKKAFRRPG